jgi:c(7)-type cytochrome triheme protein
MKLMILVLILAVSVAFVGSAVATPPGKTIEFADGDQGKVIFSGDTHGPKQGMKCNDCHPKPFAMKKGAFKMTKEDHGKPDYCGKCHDGKEHYGKVVFSQSNEADCSKCHKKEEMKPEGEIKPGEEMKPEGEMKPEQEMKPEE